MPKKTKVHLGCSNPDCKRYDPKAEKLCMACWLKEREKWRKERFGNSTESNEHAG